MIVTFNATAYDGGPSGARSRAVGLAAALLRRGVSVRAFVPLEGTIREDIVREHGGVFPEDHFEQMPARLDPRRPVRRFLASRDFLARRISRDTDALVTDYFPVLTKLPTFLTVHDLRYFEAPRHEPFLRGALFRATFPKLARKAAHVVVPTDAVKGEVLRRTGCDAARVVVAGNGLSRVWRETAPADGRGEHLVAVGMSERRKDLPLLFAALRRAPGAPPLVVTHRGRAPGGAGDLVKAGRVRFVASPSDEDLADLVRRAAALLHPSRYEGFGLPVIEAMALGVPVLAARQAAVAEVAGGFAALLPPGDVDAWAAALRDLPRAPEGARAHALSFTWDRAAAALLAALESG